MSNEDNREIEKRIICEALTEYEKNHKDLIERQDEDFKKQFYALLERYDVNFNDLPSDICLTADNDYELPDNLADNVNEYLSSKYGFCVESYDIEMNIKNIVWDTSE